MKEYPTPEKMKEIQEELAHKNGYASFEELSKHLHEEFLENQRKFEAKPRVVKFLYRMYYRVRGKFWSFMVFLGWEH